MVLLKVILWRAGSILLTFLVITAVLYAIVMLVPVERRAMLYWSSRTPIDLLEPEEVEEIRADIIEERGLDDPYPVQYTRWLSRLLQGDWGWSRRLNQDVLSYLLARTPMTAELTFYSVLIYIPLGLLGSVITGWRQGRLADHTFRLAAFIATSIPPFVLGLVLLAIFYVGLGWVSLISPAASLVIHDPGFHRYTGLITIDGLLNGRPDISLEAARRLILPVITLSLVHWATLGRITRATMIEELQKEYIVAAQARGLRTRAILYRHALRNAIPPLLTSIALSAATLVSGVYVIEAIFNLHGVSELLLRSLELSISGGPAIDAPVALGFAVYSVLLVLLLLFVLDVLQAIADPRSRERLGES
jgi:peptide/nickel transport system permease protein